MKACWNERASVHAVVQLGKSTRLKRTNRYFLCLFFPRRKVVSSGEAGRVTAETTCLLLRARFHLGVLQYYCFHPQSLPLKTTACVLCGRDHCRCQAGHNIASLPPCFIGQDRHKEENLDPSFSGSNANHSVVQHSYNNRNTLGKRETSSKKKAIDAVVCVTSCDYRR